MKYYQTKTQEDYDDLMEFLEVRGYLWCDGDTPTSSNEWVFNKENTVIEVDKDDKEITFWNKPSVIENSGGKENIIAWEKEGIEEMAITAPIETLKLNNPTHYKINGKDTMEIIIEIVKANSTSVEETIYLFNTLKYLVRYGRKNGKEDLLKAKDYLERLINEKEKEEESDV